MIKSYLKTAFRNLTRNKIYSFINIVGLSIGLASAMLIMLYVKDEVSFDRFHKNIGQIYRIVNKTIKPDGGIEGFNGNSGYFQGPKFTSSIPEIRSFVRFQSDTRDVKMGTEIKSQEVFYTDTSFFSTFSFPLINGNPQTALQLPNSVVISEDIAKAQFGSINAMGKVLYFKSGDVFESYIVTGVTKKCPQNSTIKFDVLLPMKVSKEDVSNNENWFNFFNNTFVMLVPGADTTKVEAKMKNVYEADAAATIKMMAEKYDVKTKTIYFLQPFLNMHLDTKLDAGNGLVNGSNPVYSYILSGIALFILVIACINFVNLTLARSVKRAREIGIRKVVGGDRKQLIMQFLGESFILCFVAFALAIMLVKLAIPVFNTLSNKALSLSYLFDTTLVLGYFGLFIITGFLAGFYPSLILSNYNPVQTLYSRFTLSGKNYLQKSLVILQFSLASFLIISTITIFFQFNFLISQKLGYDDSHLVTVSKRELNKQEFALFKNELLKSGIITGVSPKNGGSWGTIAKVNGETQINFAYETIDKTYLPLLHIPVVSGRNFSPDLHADSTHSVLVNESFAKEAGWKDPVGKEVNFWYNNNEKYTVIGVVKDYHFEDLTRKIGSQLFTMKPGILFGKVFIKIKPGNETAALHHIEKVFKQLFPFAPYAYTFIDQQNRMRYEAEAKWKQIMLFSAILTIFISSIGLFGLSVLSAEKRIKEIGVRKVLGASIAGIVALLSREFVQLVVISLLIAVPLAWIAANKWLENYPYRITLQWWMFASAGVMVILVAIITVSSQALKAAAANPVKSLRTE